MSDAAHGSSATAENARYEILEEHGRGGLGRVSRARDHELERDVAIKELIARGGASEARFRREALITARLEHPGIVPVHETGRWPDGTPYYAMKLVAGRPLRALIAERKAVAARLELLHHLIAVADAIAYAHGRGIIHRDLKPANVIVGDFGETVVIDWGLAKEVGAPDEAEVAGSDTAQVAKRLRDLSGEGLTKTGTVLGTPAYMAPEQERGEAVDQRADVFALGAMLWELCALERVPPLDRRQRHGLLRRNGIDIDLIAILDKCLDPQPARRYGDAAGLVADLKAFKSGARIAARSYSFAAMFGHWARRNRRRAVAALALALVAIGGIALYARDLSAERGRVDAANQRLILENARALMTLDPTAAYELLQTYQGNDETLLAILRAEAQGRGVSVQHIRPDRAVASQLFPVLGGIVRREVGGQISKVSALGATKPLLYERTEEFYDRAEQTSVIAYQCPNHGVCLYDAVAERQLRAPTGMADSMPRLVSLSSNGKYLAALAAAGVTLWRLSLEGADAELAHVAINGNTLVALNDGTVWVAGDEGVSMRGVDGVVHRVVHPRLTHVGDVRVSHRGDVLAFGTLTGAIVVVDAATRKVLGSEVVCPDGQVDAVPMLHGRTIVYYCEETAVIGVWDRTQGEKRALGATFFAFGTSLDDQYLYIGKTNGEILVYDAEHRVFRGLLGHAGGVTTLAPPTYWYPYLVTADSSGNLRSWQLESRPVVDEFSVGLSRGQAFTPLCDGSMIIQNMGPMIAYSSDGVRRTVPASDALMNRMSASSSYVPAIARFGYDDLVRIWRFGASRDYREFATGLGNTRDIVFDADPAKLTTISANGTIARWSVPAGSHEVLQRVPEPLLGSRHCGTSARVVLLGASGNLWLYETGALRWLAKAEGKVASWVCSPDGRWGAIALSTGEVHVRHWDTYQRYTALDVSRSIAALEFAADSSELAIATETGVRFLRLSGPRTIASSLAPSSTLPLAEIARPELVAYSPDNRWVAIAGDHGGVWFHRRADAHWVFVSVGEARVLRGQFTSDSARFFAQDADGNAHVISMTAATFR